MPSTNFLKLWRPHQSSEISFKKLTNLFNKYLGLGFYLIHSQIPSTYHNASNIVDTHWIPIYWMNVESWKTKQYYELCLMHIRKSHGCLLANEEECRLWTYFKQTKAKRQNRRWQMPTLYPGTFFSLVTFEAPDHFPHTSTEDFSRRTPLTNKAHYSTLSGILPMLNCTAFQNKVNTMLGDPVLVINRNPVTIPICPQCYLTVLVSVC